MRRDHEPEPVLALYEQLARALLTTRPDPFGAPVTVAEIYQELAPYRAVRGEGGFAMNADYEHALLRLLSGEDGLVRLEPASAREVILKELKSPNPNVTIYRAYAGCDAWIRPRDDWQPENVAPDDDRVGDDHVGDIAGAAAGGGEDDAGQRAGYHAEGRDAADAQAAGGGATVSSASPRCIFCDSELPRRRTARY